MAAHHGHDAATPPCSSFDAQCDDVDDVIDSRAGKIKAKDLVDLKLVVSHDYVDLAERPVWQARGSTDPPDFVLGFTPIHVLNCVYLD